MNHFKPIPIPEDHLLCCYGWYTDPWFPFVLPTVSYNDMKIGVVGSGTLGFGTYVVAVLPNGTIVRISEKIGETDDDAIYFSVSGNTVFYTYRDWDDWGRSFSKKKIMEIKIDNGVLQNTILTLAIYHFCESISWGLKKRGRYDYRKVWAGGCSANFFSYKIHPETKTISLRFCIGCGSWDKDIKEYVQVISYDQGKLVLKKDEKGKYPIMNGILSTESEVEKFLDEANHLPYWNDWKE